MGPFKGVSTNIFSMFTVNRETYSLYFCLKIKVVINHTFIETITDQGFKAGRAEKLALNGRLDMSSLLIDPGPTLIFTSLGASFFTSVSSRSPKPEKRKK